MKLYRFLLHFYPARFREEYARLMEIAFGDDLRETSTFGARVRVWTRALKDLAISIPGELAREMGRDLQHAGRLYAKRKLVTASAVIALALAIGATTGIFSVANAVLLRELPFREPDRLVTVKGGSLASFATKATFADHRKDAQLYLQDGAIFTTNLVNLERNGAPYRVRATDASPNFFDVLGMQPALGRAFLNEDESVAVVSQRLWRQNFGSDPALLGSRISLNGVTLTVVGIAPALFDYPEKTDVWTSTALDIMRIPKPSFFVQATGRLRAGLTLDQARARFKEVVLRSNSKAYELPPGNRNEENLPQLTPLRTQLARPLQSAALVLLITAAFVLLIACANIAQLLLARLHERRQEFAVRAAIGASRARLIQQLIVEALALTVTASVAGLWMAQQTAQWMATFAPASLDSQAYSILDVRVLGFAVGIALLSGLMFGVIPAAALAKLQPSQETVSLRGSSAGAGRLRAALVMLQTALTVVLLAGTFTMGRAFLSMLNLDLGIQTQNVIALTASLDGTLAAKNPPQFYQQVAERLRATPGVEAVGATMNLPLQRYAIYPGASFTLDSGQKGPVFSSMNSVGSGLFESLHQGFLAGRDFIPEERTGSQPALIVNEEFARGTGLGTAVVGHRMQGKEGATIVGVVRAARANGPAGPPGSAVYRPIEKSSTKSAAFAVRVRGDAAQYIPILLDAARSVDPAVPFHDIKLMDDLLAEQMARPRFYMYSVAALGAFALLLSVIGIYGVATNSIAQRTKEIGVRIAVGATPSSVRRMVLLQNATPLVVGLFIGIGGTVALGRYAASLLSSAEAPGILLTSAAMVFLLTASVAAAWRATGRVVKLDPMQALRAD